MTFHLGDSVIFENEPECIKLLDAQGTLLKLNPAGLRTFEAESFEQFKDRNIYSFVAEEHHPAFRKLIERVFQGEPGTLEFQVVGLQGGRRWLEIHASPLRVGRNAVTALLGIARDVTERKRTSDSLREQDERLELALDAARMGQWDWNIQTGEIVWSAGCFEIYGLDPKIPMTYERFLGTLHPDDKDRIDQALRDVVTNRSTYDQEKRVILPDKSIRWTASRGRIYCDSAGQPVRLTGVTFDITERKLAEEQRQSHVWFLESMAKVNQILQGTSDLEQMMDEVLGVIISIFNCDRAWLVYPCDPNASSWRVPMERTKPEFPGAFALKLDVPMNGEVRQVFETVRAARGPVQFGPGSNHSLGESIADQFSVQSQMAMVLRPKVDQPYLFGLHQCSHPRVWSSQEERLFEEIGHRLAEALNTFLIFRNLKESERKLEHAQRIAQVGYWDRDLSSDQAVWSDETYRIFGLPPRERRLTRAELEEMIHPEDREAALKAREEALMGRSRYDVEYRIVRRNGEVRWVQSQGDVIRNEAGRPIRLFGTVQDITQRKQPEQALRASVARMTQQETALLALSRREALSNNDLLQTLRRIIEISAQTLNVQRVSVWRFNADRTAIYCVDLYELAENRHSQPKELAVAAFPAYFQAISQSDVIVADDAQRDPRTRELSAAYLELHGITSMMDASAQVAGVLDGVVCHEHVGTARTWTADERTFAIAIANAVSLAVEESERKQAENALRKSQHAHSALVNTIDGIVWEADPDTFQFQFVSQQAQLMLGYSIDRWINEPNFWREHIHPEDRDWAVNFCVLAVERKENHDFQYRMIAEDGRVIWLHDRVTVVVEGDRVIKLRGIMVDITESKKREEALRESEERFRELAETIEDVFWVSDPAKNCILYVSPGYEKIWGRTSQSLYDQPRSWLEAIHPDDRDRVLTAATTRQTEGTYDEEYRIIRPDGTIRWIRDLAFPVRDAAGEAVRVLGVARDITERKGAIEALRESSRLLTKAQQVGRVGSWVSEHGQNGKLSWSEETCRIFGFAPKEFDGQLETFFSLVHPDDRRRVECTARAALAGEVLYDLDHRIIRRDGQTRWVHEQADVEHDAGGRIIRMVGVVQDITERVELEDQLRQSQKMDAIGQLAGGVAHDFNNILAAIMTQSELARVGQHLPAEVEEDLQQICAAAKRAANLTRQLLLFSRREVMQLQEVDLNESVLNLSKMLQRIIGEDISLELKLHRRPLITQADAGMLDQVLMNLAVNARDAMPEGGRLTIETFEHFVDLKQARRRPDAAPGPYVGMSVTDTGYGIAPEVLPRIFEPFFTTKAPGKGTGLGLATVFGIVRQHRGWIDVHSRPGHGAKFQVFLPIATAQSGQRNPQAAKPKLRGGTETILLAEDDSLVRLSTGSLLKRYGYRVLDAANGAEALKLWEEHRDVVKLLLTDFVMPAGLNGLQLGRRLQQDKPNLKVVLTSGYNAEFAGQKIELQQGENFLQKPCPPDRLLETVRQLLDASSSIGTE